MLQRLKKIISALTVTAMIFGIMPIGALAENLFVRIAFAAHFP